MADKKPVKEASLLPPGLSWSDHEKDQMWVSRYDEIHIETALWRYCVSRHKQRWLGTKRHQGPPSSYSEGKGIGWWFPAIWTKDFKPALPSPDRPSNPQMAARVGRVFSGAATVGIGNHPFPSMEEFRRWNLPADTLIVAADGTVIYPNGAVEKWTSIQQRLKPAKAAPPEPSKPQAPTEEPAVTPSPQLIAAMQRKEWLAKAERGEVEASPDPDAWRSEMTNT
jgi:hypothetical protein